MNESQTLPSTEPGRYKFEKKSDKLEKCWKVENKEGEEEEEEQKEGEEEFKRKKVGRKRNLVVRTVGHPGRQKENSGTRSAQGFVAAKEVTQFTALMKKGFANAQMRHRIPVALSGHCDALMPVWWFLLDGSFCFCLLPPSRLFSVDLYSTYSVQHSILGTPDTYLLHNGRHAVLFIPYCTAHYT